MSRQAYEKAGRRAETLAVWYLRVKGYYILSRRYKTKAGEIDIIAVRGKIVAIVEVKQRETREAAEASLTTLAEKRISTAAEVFLSRTPSVQNKDMRFDLIFIIGRWRIFHIPDAWRDY